jgi:hypothetical protein
MAPNLTNDRVEADLSVARAYLLALSRALLEAAQSPDPRVTALGLALARYQGVHP